MRGRHTKAIAVALAASVTLGSTAAPALAASELKPEREVVSVVRVDADTLPEFVGPPPDVEVAALLPLLAPFGLKTVGDVFKLIARLGGKALERYAAKYEATYSAVLARTDLRTSAANPAITRQGFEFRRRLYFTNQADALEYFGMTCVNFVFGTHGLVRVTNRHYDKQTGAVATSGTQYYYVDTTYYRFNLQGSADHRALKIRPIGLVWQETKVRRNEILKGKIDLNVAVTVRAPSATSAKALLLELGTKKTEESRDQDKLPVVQLWVDPYNLDVLPNEIPGEWIPAPPLNTSSYSVEVTALETNDIKKWFDRAAAALKKFGES